MTAPIHVTSDTLEALAFTSGALIDMGGTYPTARVNGVRYVASLVDVPLLSPANVAAQREVVGL